MKFSILIPTRNRLDLLRYAIESVRRQEYDDWEIVVSDNNSDQDVGGYVSSLSDPRIRYLQTDRFLPVTDNWNNAIDNSQGDYIIMLGDDDCLLKGCLNSLAELVTEFADPDALYLEAVQFCYPGVAPGHPKGFVQTSYSDLLRGHARPFLIRPEEAVRAVRKSMSLRFSFSYNMQHCVVSRRLVLSLVSKGPFFQGPYPDYYASNVVMLEATEILAVPQAMIGIGISPRSFGYYYLNHRAGEGMAELATLADRFVPREVRARLLPGNPLLSSWYASMAWVEHNFGDRHGVRVDTSRYRYLQAIYAVRAEGLGAVLAYWPLLDVVEKVHLVVRAMVLWLPSRALRGRLRSRYVDSFWRKESPWPTFDAHVRTVDHMTILDLFEAMPATEARL